jgi:hypothetical protein
LTLGQSHPLLSRHVARQATQINYASAENAGAVTKTAGCLIGDLDFNLDEPAYNSSTGLWSVAGATGATATGAAACDGANFNIKDISLGRTSGLAGEDTLAPAAGFF